jgi:hypothetical protein
VSVFKLAAFVCFLFATLAGFGWVLTWDLGTVLGLIAAGLGFWVASTLDTSISL